MESVSGAGESTENTRPIIVGIGASTGGLEALARLLSSMPARHGMAFVVVLHLDPRQESKLAGALAAHTAMPVREVREPTQPRAGEVYVIPSDKYLGMREGALVPEEVPASRTERRAVDSFFRALAEDRGEYAIGIVLSGSGSDGTAGLRDIKSVGGLVIAQDPDEAAHTGMPLSAIESGHVDLVLPIERMAAVLVGYARHSYMHGPLTAQALQSRERDYLGPVIQLLRERTEADFRRYRKNTLLRRIQRRMGLRQIDDISDYLHLLRDNRAEAKALVRDLLIGVTSFFRDPEAWSRIEDKVIPELCKDYDGRILRVWIPGCATGEEAYTMSILLHEYAERTFKPCRFQIFATDIAEDALEVGRAGLYPESIARDISRKRLLRFFTREKNGYRVNKSLRESVVFASQNLLSQPPFSKLDLVSCRNLLIYLEPEAQRRLLSIFQFALRVGGFLFLGCSESLGESSDHFDPVSKKWRIHRRNALHTSPLTDFSNLRQEGAEASKSAPEPRRRRQGNIAERVHNQLLGESEAALAVINGDNRLVFLQGPADIYLQLPSGELQPQLPNLLEACRDGLRAKVRAVLQRVRQLDETAQAEARVKRGGRYLPCLVLARPLLGGDPNDRSILLSFVPQAQQTAPAPPVEESSPQDSTIRDLELELSTTREQLNSTIEQLESTNEELKAANEEAMATNEELQSANEELETSKEELQSLNEELSTLNHRLENKLELLQSTTNDLVNLFSSTPVATLFLDTGFHIRRFTPACTELFHLIDGDVGRPLSDITRRFQDDALLLDAEAVLHDLQPREAHLRSERQRAYVRRILPYRSEDNRIEGVVITFNDVTELQNLTQQLRARDRQHAALARLGEQALTDDRIDVLLNQAVELAGQVLGTEFTKILELDHDTGMLLLKAGVGWREGLVGDLRVPLSADSQAAYTLRQKTPVIVEDLAADTRFSSPALLTEHGVASGMSVIIPGTDRPYGALGVHTRSKVVFTEDDVNFLQSLANVLGEAIERQRVARALRASEQRFRMVADNIAQLAWTTDRLGVGSWYNKRWYEFTGAGLEEMRGDGWRKVVHPEHFERVREKLDRCAASHEPWEDVFPMRRHDGIYRWFLSRAVPILDDKGDVSQWFGTNTDITERMEMEAALKQADRRKDDFLATLAHELRNPLAPIRTSLEILPGADESRRKEIHRILERQTSQLSRLVDELMDVSRISRGKVSLKPQDVRLEEVLQGAVEATQDLMDQKGHELSLELPDPPQRLHADPVRLTQVVLNLLSNAAHYTPPGGRISLSARREGDELAIRVRDNGVGMPPDMLDRIFDAFTQIENPLTKSQSGLGIGLTLARALVELHGGSIRAESAGPGKGTRFTVRIPLRPPAASGTSEPPPAVEKTGRARPRRVMVVDDNEDAATTLAMLLRLKGHEVQVVFSGAAALEAGPEFLPDLVLMDLGMPGMNGIEAAQAVRAQPWGQDLLLVAVTGWGQDSHRSQTRAAGFDLHLVKPVTTEDLDPLLARAPASRQEAPEKL